MFKSLVVLTALAALTGCATHNVQLYGPIDNSNKTVTVPPGSEGLKGKLKSALANDGWKLVVYRGPSVTEGEIGEKTKVEQYDTFNSRYRLIASSYQFDLCLNFTPAIKYDISFIDNKSGAEVFTINGRGCEPDAVEKFMNALRGKDK
ncbi:MAG: hypothetical protein DID92_2727744966 [Candidatus Nitrotoga sp. SPKER]|nr:MAG: hypothetical protein DID92_2727744966 [Candidatus Nitrotoga sp. SPKER]